VSGRSLFAAPVAALALAAAACGGGDGGDLGSGADVAPASSAFFMSLNTDFESDQWRRAEMLVDRFPGGKDAVRDFLRQLREDEVDFERDVKPAVGPEVDFVILDLDDDDAVVVLTQPRDKRKFADLVEKADEPLVTEEIDDWTAAAESREILDRFRKERGGDSLAKSDPFRDATGDLPDDALAHFFVNSDALTKQIATDETTADERQALECFLPGAKIPSLGFSLSAEDKGARFQGTARNEEREAPEEYEAGLASELPAGALAYVSFRNLAGQLRDALRCAGEANSQFDRQLAQVELALGVSLDDDLLPLLENEGALAVYRAPESQLAQNSTQVGIPTITLVTEVDDAAKALGTVDTIARRASAFAQQVRVDEVDVGGVDAKRVTIAGEATLFYAALEGKLVVTSSEEGILGLRENGTRLDDDPVYKRAREAADAPGETAGFAYVNLADGVGYLLRLAEGSGEQVPPHARENLEPLSSLFVYETVGDDELTYEGFLEVE
jgi:Protein of unknown function (DUF3352)